ncbi:MAG TPA: ANTAR domain-containing protein [Microbacterium sp.]|nr:ANTAR domain-containing protein [Microbacterium sp.]
MHQATGMVIAQMRIPADDALLVIRAHAFASDRSVAQIASDIVERRMDFSD